MNAKAHRLVAAAVVAIAAAYHESCKGESTPKPIAAGGLAALLGTLPDLIEPAFNNPHHRQFFHSLLFAGVIGYGMYELYQWQPNTDEKKFLRWILLIAGGAYLTHLAMDACTKRSLPLCGKL